MAFATLDDVEGQVEMLVIGKAYEESRSRSAVDSVVVVRGRLDHKERGQTKLVVQELEVFQPSEDEVARARAARTPGPVIRRVTPPSFGASLIEELKSLSSSSRGDRDDPGMETREGLRRLQFGEDYRVQALRGACTPSSTPCSVRPPRPRSPRISDSRSGRHGDTRPPKTVPAEPAAPVASNSR